MTSKSVLAAGELLVTASKTAGIVLLLYFLYVRHANAPRPVIVADSVLAFAKNSTPYAVNFLACWCLKPALERLIASCRPAVALMYEYLLTSKVTFNVAAFVAKHYLFTVRPVAAKTALLVGHLTLVAASEVACGDWPVDRAAANSAVAALLFWLTVLLLVAPSDAYRKLKLTEMLTWKRCSLAYGLLTGVCYTWFWSGSEDGVLDALLVVLVVHVQLVCLCVTYFSDGQQLLRNVTGAGTYNPMADSLDIYFTINSIRSRTSAYVNLSSAAA